VEQLSARRPQAELTGVGAGGQVSTIALQARLKTQDELSSMKCFVNIEKM
jgi:hypothetical protein